MALGVKSNSISVCCLIANVTGKMVPKYGHSLYQIQTIHLSSAVTFVINKEVRAVAQQGGTAAS